MMTIGIGEAFIEYCKQNSIKPSDKDYLRAKADYYSGWVSALELTEEQITEIVNNIKFGNDTNVVTK